MRIAAVTIISPESSAQRALTTTAAEYRTADTNASKQRHRGFLRVPRGTADRLVRNWRAS